MCNQNCSLSKVPDTAEKDKLHNGGGELIHV